MKMMQTAEPATQGQDTSKLGLDTHQRQNSVTSRRHEEVSSNLVTVPM